MNIRIITSIALGCIIISITTANVLYPAPADCGNIIDSDVCKKVCLVLEYTVRLRTLSGSRLVIPTGLAACVSPYSQTTAFGDLLITDDKFIGYAVFVRATLELANDHPYALVGEGALTTNPSLTNCKAKGMGMCQVSLTYKRWASTRNLCMPRTAKLYCQRLRGDVIGGSRFLARGVYSDMFPPSEECIARTRASECVGSCRVLNYWLSLNATSEYREIPAYLGVCLPTADTTTVAGHIWEEYDVHIPGNAAVSLSFLLKPETFPSLVLVGRAGLETNPTVDRCAAVDAGLCTITITINGYPTIRKLCVPLAAKYQCNRHFTFLIQGVIVTGLSMYTGRDVTDAYCIRITKFLECKGHCLPLLYSMNLKSIGLVTTLTNRLGVCYAVNSTPPVFGDFLRQNTTIPDLGLNANLTVTFYSPSPAEFANATLVGEVALVGNPSVSSCRRVGAVLCSITVTLNAQDVVRRVCVPKSARGTCEGHQGTTLPGIRIQSRGEIHDTSCLLDILTE